MRSRTLALGGLAAAVIALVASCQRAGSLEEKTCAGASAMSAADAPLHGWSLPPKTLALTFDDGPGARTLELSAWLASHAIHVGFFVNGKNVWDSATLAQVVADGHVLGNHTQDHRSLTGHATGTPRLTDAETFSEIAQTDALIAPFVTNGRFLFRPPYGDYDAQSYAQIQATAMAKYYGPIDWDIGGKMGPTQATDWDCWQAGSDGKVLTIQQCGDLYLDEIDAVGRGIVLMHDPYFIGGDPSKGGTVDMIPYLVPKLIARGYSFVRVDEVPDIAALLPPLPTPSSADASTDPSESSSGAPSASIGGARSPSRDPAAAKSDRRDPSGDNPEPCPPSPQDPAGNTALGASIRAR